MHPNHNVRIETDQCPLETIVVKKFINLWIKIATVSDDTLPKPCLRRLRLLDNDSNNYNMDYSWVSQIK